MTDTLRIGTRGSRLALWQAHHVRDLLKAAHPHLAVEISIVKTSGDRDRNTPLAATGGIGFFTKEIQEELLAGRVDLAVHSLKDLPTTLIDGLALGAVPAREDTRDALFGRPGRVRSLADLGPGVRVATSSPRRKGQLLAACPGIEVEGIRGNVSTRIEKVREDPDGPDATILAIAGVTRLGLLDLVTEVIPHETMLPAVGQGALGLEIRADDGRTRERLVPLEDPHARAAVTAERAFLARLEGGCTIPAGAWARPAGDGRLAIDAAVADPDGREVFRASREGDAADPAALGLALAEDLLAGGAGPLLERIRSEAP
jgi:hydroxymethylbilane synthase